MFNVKFVLINSKNKILSIYVINETLDDMEWATINLLVTIVGVETISQNRLNDILLRSFHEGIEAIQENKIEIASGIPFNYSKKVSVIRKA